MSKLSLKEKVDEEIRIAKERREEAIRLSMEKERKKQEEERKRREELEPLADGWIEKNLPTLVRECLKAAPSAWMVELKSVNYEDRYLSPYDLSKAAERAGFRTKYEHGNTDYGEGCLVEFESYFVIFGEEPRQEPYRYGKYYK